MNEIKKLNQFPSLSTLGVATEFFPNYENHDLLLHGVDVVLLSMILSGHGTHYLPSGSLAEKGKSLTVTHYGEQHSIIADTGMRILNIYLNIKQVPLPTIGSGLDHFLQIFLPQSSQRSSPRRIYRLQLEDDNPEEGLAMALHQELTQKETGYQTAAQAYLKLFLLQCCRRIKASGIQEINLDEASLRMWNVRNYLDRHFSENITLENLAENAHYQRNYLCRLFRKIHGMAIMDYLLNLRLNQAAQKLQSGQDKILSIALDCGFSDSSYFSRMFKRRFGCTPMRYRDLHANASLPKLGTGSSALPVSHRQRRSVPNQSKPSLAQR